MSSACGRASSYGRDAHCSFGDFCTPTDFAMIWFMIKALLFDYDGVITAQSSGTKPSELLAKLLEMNREDVDTLFMALWPGYLRGRLSDTEFWQRVESQSGKKVPLEKRNIWTKWYQLKPLPQMVELVKELRAEGHPVGLLTNVTPTTEEDVRAHGGYAGFDFVIQSCKIGFAKPDPEVYALALKQLNGVEPHEVVFVDDRERCLTPARELGIHTILAQSAEQVTHDIRALLKIP